MEPLAQNQMFSSEVVEALSRIEGGALTSVPPLALQYILFQPKIPGAPLITDLKPDQTRAIIGVPSFKPDVDVDWAGYLERVQGNEDFEQKANSPFFPIWDSKTPDRPNPWVSQTGENIDDINKTALNQLFSLWQRPWAPGIDTAEVMEPAPIQDAMVMRSIVEALSQFATILVRPMGTDTGKNEDFRWCTTIPVLASLGYSAFRQFASIIAPHTDETVFNHWQTISDKELTENLVEAQALSGYPIHLSHVDCTDLIAILERCKLAKAPSWLPGQVLIHFMKHTRYYQNLNGKNYLFAAYRGRFAFVQLVENGWHSPLGSPFNKNVLSTLKDILRLNTGSGKKKTPCEIAIAGVLNHILPSQVTRPIPPRRRPDIIIAPEIQIVQAIPNQHERKRKWIDPGILVKNVATFDGKTGFINKTDAISDELAVSMEWPLAQKLSKAVKNWINELPNKVSPMRPHELAFGWIRNVNPLGVPRGLKHLYDTVMIMDLVRDELAGTYIGGLADKEFPPVWCLPMGATEEDTTNQGKTNFCVMTAKILVPNITHCVCSGTTSPPAQRSAASPIEQFGMAVYDEFTMPRSPDHFLHMAGFASLCTGGTINPGRALENATGLRLSHPLFLAAKAGPEAEDIRNRSVMFFMNKLDESNSAVGDELTIVTSGIASAVIRLSALLWINENNIVAKIRDLKPISGAWRFNAHLAVVKMLAGEDFPEVEKYLKAATEQCKTHQQDLSDTNLMGELGYAEKFNPEWYIQNADVGTLKALAMNCHAKGSIRALDALRALVEDGVNRVFAQELRNKHTQENVAVGMLTRRLTRGPIVHGPFTITLHVDKIKTANSTLSRAVVITEQGGIVPVKLPS